MTPPRRNGGDGSDLLVVGAGLFGLTVAREAAERYGLSVTVVDRRSHLGGNAFDRPDTITGITVHPYGSHIFHTSNASVFAYLETNAALVLNSYRHQVFSTVTRQTMYPGPALGVRWTPKAVVPMPVTLQTINTLRLADGLSPLSPAEARTWLDQQTRLYRDSDEDTRGFEESALATYGPLLYNDLIAGYTEKQWGTAPSDLPRSTIARIPAPHTTYRAPGYFPKDRWQGIPKHGYAQLAAALVDYPGIHLRLGYDHLAPTDHHRWTKAHTLGQIPTVFTGAPDAYFDYAEGHLGWRTIDLKWDHPNTKDFQGTAVMNYPQLPPAGPAFTRCHEFRHLHPERESQYPTDRTVIATETSRAADITKGDEPYYPIRSPRDTAMLRAYRQHAADVSSSVAFGGRLGSYLYFDMDMAVAAALSFAHNTLPDLVGTRARDAAPQHA